MKKVILMVAMVFATSGLVNANSSVEADESYSCVDYAQTAEAIARNKTNISEEEAFRVFSKAFEECDSLPQ